LASVKKVEVKESEMKNFNDFVILWKENRRINWFWLKEK
jgi:hypothetical protein